MNEDKIMSAEAFNELIDGFEIVGSLTEYGRRNVKYHVKKLQEENQQLKDVIDKAIKYINDNSWYFNDEDSGAMFCLEEEKEETFCNDLLSILKEVE